MRRFAILVAVLIGTPVVLAADAEEEALKAELQRLQGTWVYESYEIDGKAEDAEKLKARTFSSGSTRSSSARTGRSSRKGRW